MYHFIYKKSQIYREREKLKQNKKLHLNECSTVPYSFIFILYWFYARKKKQVEMKEMPL